jgi:hypothetical protein
MLNDQGIEADERLISDIVSQVKQLGEKNGEVSNEEVNQFIKKISEASKNG